MVQFPPQITTSVHNTETTINLRHTIHNTPMQNNTMHNTTTDPIPNPDVVRETDIDSETRNEVNNQTIHEEATTICALLHVPDQQPSQIEQCIPEVTNTLRIQLQQQHLNIQRQLETSRL